MTEPRTLESGWHTYFGTVPYDNIPLPPHWREKAEWADDPRYPEKYSALGLRLGVNYVVRPRM